MNLRNLDKEVLDETILLEGFSLSALWLLREQLQQLIEVSEQLKDTAFNIIDFTLLNETETNLDFLVINLDIVERVMIDKEGDIFEAGEYIEMCYN